MKHHRLLECNYLYTRTDSTTLTESSTLSVSFTPSLTLLLLQMSRRIDRKTGFSNLKYHLVKKIELTIAGAKINFVNVEVHCDYAITPFCDNPT